MNSRGNEGTVQRASKDDLQSIGRPRKNMRVSQSAANLKGVKEASPNPHPKTQQRQRHVEALDDDPVSVAFRDQLRSNDERSHRSLKADKSKKSIYKEYKQKYGESYDQDSYRNQVKLARLTNTKKDEGEASSSRDQEATHIQLITKDDPQKAHNQSFTDRYVDPSKLVRAQKNNFQAQFKRGKPKDLNTSHEQK